MSAENAAVVTTALEGRVLVVSINNPPVNALSQAVRQGLADAVAQAQADAQVQAVLLVGSGKAFIAGADIREFGKPAMPPSLPDVLMQLESSNKLVVAAIHGPALGGGLEVALSCHYRLAVSGAKLGLPEVQLGLLPGAGGTQRTPRLIGVKAALDLMLLGRHAGAEEALSMGLVDKVEPAGTDARTAGLAYANQLLDDKAPVRRTREATALADKAAAQAELDTIKADSAKKTRGLFSPGKIIECVQGALDLPFDEGMKNERKLFVQCLESPQRAGLIHAFFAERETAKIPEAKAAAPRALNTLGVIGGGTMGAGITVAALDAGFPVVMVERDEESIARGRANVEKVYDGLIAKGRMTAENKAAIMATLAFHTQVGIDDVSVEGITKITAADIAAATAEHKVIKLLAVVEHNEAGVSARVYPALINENHPLASVHGSFNAVFIKAKEADDIMLYGRGAGGAPTASAVVGDVVMAARNIVSGTTATGIQTYNTLPLAPADASKAAFAVRFLIHDKPGVLASIAEEFANHGISINGVNQDLQPTQHDPGYSGELQQLRIVTHLCDEVTLRKTVDAVCKLECVSGEPSILRVLD